MLRAAPIHALWLLSLCAACRNKAADPAPTSTVAADAQRAKSEGAPPTTRAPDPPPAKGATEDEFVRFLPPEVLKPLVAGLRKVPFDRKGLDAAPSVKFVSGESSFFSFRDPGKRIYIVNEAHLFEQERFDYWLLHQTTEEPGLFTDTTRFVIVVDKIVVPRRSYFLQFHKRPVLPGELPSPIGFTTSCFTCHPNGPRAVRPQLSELVPPLTESDKARIARWNRLIAAYRETETWYPEYVPSPPPKAPPEDPFRPPPGYEVPLREPDDPANEDLKIAACVECHRKGSGVRSPIYRQNAESILVMLHYPVNPAAPPRPIPGATYTHLFDEHPGGGLTPGEQECLLRWLQQQGSGDGSCNDPSRPAHPSPPSAKPDRSASLWLDPGRSRLTVHAQTLFAAIPLGNLGLSGSLRCASSGARPNGCDGQLMADLSLARTGISLRDRHLRTHLKTRQFPFAVVDISKVSWASISGEGTIRAELEVSGVPAQYDVTVRCASEPDGIRCRLGELMVRPSRHGLKDYGFMGALVEDRVKITGDLFFRPGA